MRVFTLRFPATVETSSGSTGSSLLGGVTSLFGGGRQTDKPATIATRPFCSPRCRDVDLNRWLSGTYIVPGRDDEESE